MQNQTVELLTYIVKLLYQKGYRPFNEENGGVLVRETQECVYIITLSTFRMEVPLSQYENAKLRTEFMVTTKYKKACKTLHLISIDDDELEDVHSLANGLPNTWILSKSTGRIYIFENQSQQFDDLYKYLEDGITAFSRNKPKDEFAFSFEPVNMTIVAINILYFIFIIIYNKGYYAVYDTGIMLKMGALSYDTFMQGAWYQIITSVFMHFGLSHLVNNMVLLTYVGCELERRLGKVKYLLLYLITGICGNVASLWYYNYIGTSAVSAGASGAIFGVIGALFVVLIVNHIKTQNLTATRLLLMACVTIYYGMTTMGVDNAAHIGGLISGIISGFLLSKISQYGKLE